MCLSAAVESTGAAKAEAQSRAEAARIQGEAAVEEAKLKAQAQGIEAVCHSLFFSLFLHSYSVVFLLLSTALLVFDIHLPSQEAELARLSKARDQELSYKKEMDRLEVDKQQKLAEIESQRFSQLVGSLGTETLKEMARAGPELQVHSCLTGSLKKGVFE